MILSTSKKCMTGYVLGCYERVCVCAHWERTRSRGEKIRKVGGKGKLLTMSARNESLVASNEPPGVEEKEETRMTSGMR